MSEKSGSKESVPRKRADKRSAIPAYGMSPLGQDFLREEGIVVTTLHESLLNDPRRLRPHYHDFFQLMLLRGRGQVMHDFRDYLVNGATLICLSPGQVHTIRPRPGFDAVIVSFTQSFFDHGSPPPSLLLDLPLFFPVDEAPMLPIPRGDRFRIAEAFSELEQEFHAAETGAANTLRAWLHILLTRAQRLLASEPQGEAPTRSSRLVREFHLAVERWFRAERGLADYARELGITANHLNDLIHAETGRSAGSVVRGRRLLDAKRLLSHSDLTVAEVAYEVGFADPSYFGRFFRRETGVSPAEFRAEIREKYH
jgi:AraC family transcriptional activator of pobA